MSVETVIPSGGVRYLTSNTSVLIISTSSKLLISSSRVEGRTAPSLSFPFLFAHRTQSADGFVHICGPVSVSVLVGLSVADLVRYATKPPEVLATITLSGVT